MPTTKKENQKPPVATNSPETEKKTTQSAAQKKTAAKPASGRTRPKTTTKPTAKGTSKAAPKPKKPATARPEPKKEAGASPKQQAKTDEKPTTAEAKPKVADVKAKTAPKTEKAQAAKAKKPQPAKTKAKPASKAKTSASAKKTTDKAAASEKPPVDKLPVEKPAEKEQAQAKTTDEKPSGKSKPSPPRKPAAKQKPAPPKPAPAAPQPQTTGYRLLINADEPEECRVALLDKGKLESFHIETVVNAKTKGNIYKGKIVTIEPNLQAVFVDIGTGKNAFLPFSEIHPEYYTKEIDPDTHWKDLNIREVLEEGQELLVEVVKEVTGNKGANMTTYLSLPGRYVVLMPGSTSHGISKKIENESQRKKLREMLKSCNLPEGVGYIIRTASQDITKTALTKDVNFLKNLWKEIKERGQELPTPSLVYQEQNVVARFLRDHFTPEIQEILVDSQEAYEQVVNFLDLLPAVQKKQTVAKLHKGPRPLLNSFNVEEQIEQIYHPTVKLPSGGSIVINPTEALVAIDVNSGRTDKRGDFEKTIFQANMEAAEELARQLRLRDLGGLIVVDFIDMRVSAHTREVERTLKNSMKKDKAKIDFTRISKFGLMQISRQRMAAPVHAGNYVTCSHCQGRGVIKSVETQALVYLRQIQTGVTRRHVKTVQCLLPMEVGQYLLNKKRAELADLEKRYKTVIIIDADNHLPPSKSEIKFLKE